MPFRGVFPAPKATPAPYGLFSAAKVIKHGSGDEHWAGGYGVDSETCNVEGVLLDYCGSDPVTFVEPGTDSIPEKIFPFAIRVQEECLSVGWDVQDRRARILRQLELATPKGVEAELWNGSFAQELGNDNQYLSSASATTVTGAGAVEPKVALALLEQALAGCSLGTSGVIHVTPGVLAFMGSDLAQDDDGDTLLTYNGNRISAGTGYDGRGPGETVPPTSLTDSWIYATGPVEVHLGPAELMTPDNSSALDTRTNVMTHVGVRPASVFWDGCCHFAARVNLNA